MNEKWQVTVWGVRGSFPMPSADYMEYGGNTVCTTLERNGQIVVLDAGTGLAPLGASLMAGSAPARLDILFSHFHMDHLLGLYAFPPLFCRNMEIHLHGGAGLEGCLAALTGPPYWPVSLRDSPARLTFHEIRPGDTFDLNGLSVSSMAGNHPGGSIFYRLDGAGKRVTFALDCETDEQTFLSLAAFASRSDLLIWDAGFAPPDLRPGWGHSTWEQGLALGRAAEVRRVLMTHYGREYTDELLHRQEALARQAAVDGQNAPDCMRDPDGEATVTGLNAQDGKHAVNGQNVPDGRRNPDGEHAVNGQDAPDGEHAVTRQVAPPGRRDPDGEHAVNGQDALCLFAKEGMMITL